MSESAEGARLLSEYTDKTVSRVQIPIAPPQAIVILYKLQIKRVDKTLFFCAKKVYAEFAHTFYLILSFS